MIYKIEDVLEDIKNGIPLIIVDDENRENEGDLFVAAEKATYESINLMATYARGLTCTPMSSEYAVRLNLDPMTARNTDAKCTAFTVSVDAKEGTTTGISIADRLTTIKKLADINSVATDFTRPGHIFPLIAKDNGVLEREGHTEATVDLCKICGLAPVSVICEILKDDGTMALMKVEVVANMPTDNGTFKIVGFENHIDGKEHIALVKGDVAGKEGVTVRIHSECFTGDILGSLRCDCGSQLKTAMRRIDRLGEGVGADMRDYAVAAQMLKALGVKSIKLLTNNPLKIDGIQEYGMPVVEREEIEIEHNKVNKVYLKTKKERMGHLLKIK